MGFRVEYSAATFIDPKPLDPDKKYRMSLYLRDAADTTAPLRHFGEIYGENREICSMRAELVCAAVNKGIPPETQENYSDRRKTEADRSAEPFHTADHG